MVEPQRCALEVRSARYVENLLPGADGGWPDTGSTGEGGHVPRTSPGAGHNAIVPTPSATGTNGHVP